MVNPLEFLKIGGFAPQVSIAAKEALVWQTHDMMFLGGLAWNWSGRLVKSLSNEAFNELNGRNKVEIGGAPLDEQLLRTQVKDGLFKLAQPYLEASSRHYQAAIEHSNKQQDYLITKSMELKEKELEATFTLLGKLPKQTIEMILSGYGIGDYERKIGNDDTEEEDRGLQDEEKYPDRYKPNPKPTPTPEPETDKEHKVTYKFRPVSTVGRQCNGKNTYVLYYGATQKRFTHTGTKSKLLMEVRNLKTAIGRMKPNAEKQIAARYKNRCGRVGWQNHSTASQYASYLRIVQHYTALSKLVNAL